MSSHQRHGLNWFSSSLVEILPAAVYVCNSDGIVVAFNRRATELWGRTPKAGDTDEKYCGAHKLFRPDETHLPHRETPMEWCLRTGEAARDQEVIIERPDGSRVTVLVNIAPIFDEGGAQIGAVNCFQDLSAQKQAEKERAHLRDELHQAQKMQALGQLTGGIAHDFNNMLTGIIGSLDLIRRRLATGHIDDLGRFLTGASSAAARAGALVNRLLAFARRQSLEVKATDVNAIVASLEDVLCRTLSENIVLNVALESDLWPALTDASQVETALLNLAINARDAMPNGGRLTIETSSAASADPASRAPGVDGGDHVVIAVSDTGSGMSPEIVDKAFEPFVTTKPVGQGTGLGLSTIYGFIKQTGAILKF
jgi:PAS domain S-box-containing protein